VTIHFPIVKVRLNALKSLGILMANVKELFKIPSKFADIEAKLNSIANIDSSEEARHLAEKYLEVIHSNVT